MPNPTHPQRPDQSRRTEAAPPFTQTEQEQFAHWQYLVDARLIGNIAELSPETLARHAANEAALGIARRPGNIW